MILFRSSTLPGPILAGVVIALVAAYSLMAQQTFGATLKWDPSPEPSPAGYRVYQCSQLPCHKTSPSAILFATLGNVTSFNIGTPPAIQYYFITAYNFANNESDESNVVTYTPSLVDSLLADAGSDQSVPKGTLITLDGSASVGPSLTFRWSQLPGGPKVGLNGADSTHPTFSAPSVPADGVTVTFQLIVCEGSDGQCSEPDVVNVNIINVNHPPVAEAGQDQTLQQGSRVLLSGTMSYDPDVDPIIYHWTQIGGPTVTLVNATTATPSFTAPSVGSAGETLEFELMVTDPYNLTDSDSVLINVTNVDQVPLANAGSDQTVKEFTVVTLNGTGSSDPDLNSLTFNWIQTGGTSVVLLGETTARPTFTAPSVPAGGDTLTFQLVVSDGQTSSAPDTAKVHVLDTDDPPLCSLAQPSVANLWPPGQERLISVGITGITYPNNKRISVKFPSVTQDEPVSGLKSNDHSPDAVVSGNQILLRADRSESGNGRVYQAHFTATNAQGASCSGTIQVIVQRDAKTPAVNDGQLFNSFEP